MIDNPDFKDDPDFYVFPNLKYVGIELWQVKSGTLFDNVLITYDPEHAKQLAEDTWAKHKDVWLKRLLLTRQKRREKRRRQRLIQLILMLIMKMMMPMMLKVMLTPNKIQRKMLLSQRLAKRFLYNHNQAN